MAIAQQNFLKSKVFGRYHLIKFDSKGYAVYQKASPVSGVIADNDVYFYVFKGDVGWMVRMFYFIKIKDIN